MLNKIFIRKKLDPSYKLITNIRTRIWHALTDNKKPFSTMDISGTVVDTYKRWIKLPNVTGDELVEY